ncbi:NADH-quinone oxidoreductase subunit NuoH [Nanchangia anserum]|uniref:NADH-quinone oxidoreductase subunit NuoH n=1 Tax=Nanchangia anserum TaxID=2692125 RepID=UPI0030B838FE
MNAISHLAVTTLPGQVVADFTDDRWWITIIKALCIVVFLILSVIMALWVERRGLARMQTRPGPNVHGPFGLLQAIADAVKLLTKEDFWKAGVDKVTYLLAPLIAAFTAFMVYAVIPFGPNVHFGSISTPLQLADTDVAVLYILAITSVGVYGIILAGWSSNGSLPLLGSTRSAAQMISYELAMGLSLVTVFIMSGSMATSTIVAAQSPVWWGLALFPSFLIYLVAMTGEVNRLPFDLPECEGEIVAGHMTEYSSMKFAWFFLAEYINMFNVSGVATTMFLGGWRLPFGDQILGGMFHTGLWPILWFGIKVWIVMFCLIWVRGTLVRVRYDQFMKFGWKFLMPVAFAWFWIVAVMRVVTHYGLATTPQLWLGAAVVLLVILGIIWIWGARADHKIARAQEAREAELRKPFDAFAGGYPVPPLPGQVLPPSPRMGDAVGDELVTTAAKAEGDAK